VAVAHVAADPACRGVARRPHRRPLRAAGGGRPRPAAPLRAAPLRDALLRRRAQPVLAGAPRFRALVLPLLRRRGQPVPAPPRARRAPRRALPHALQRRVRAAAGPPALVLVVDATTEPAELAVLKDEVCRVVQGLPEGFMVALVTFAASVWVHDLGFERCARVVVINGERELESNKVCEIL
jgi:hypothetical protein